MNKTILLHKDGSNHGPYTWEEIRLKLADGLVLSTDYVWFTGDNEWKTIQQVMDTIKPAVSLTSRLNKKHEEEVNNSPRTKTTVLLFKPKTPFSRKPLY